MNYFLKLLKRIHLITLAFILIHKKTLKQILIVERSKTICLCFKRHKDKKKIVLQANYFHMANLKQQDRLEDR